MAETATPAAQQDHPPPPQVQKSRAPRPDIAGPDAPEPPFPISLSGAVQRGFGRGGKDLGCPTGALPNSVHGHLIDVPAANLPDESLPPMSNVTQTGVYYGYARVSRDKDGTTVLSEEDGKVLPMVMSLGWNPFYKNERLTAVRESFDDCILSIFSDELYIGNTSDA